MIYLGSVTLHKWHHLASENVVAGLNVGVVFTPEKHVQKDNAEICPIESDPIDCSSTLSNSDLVMNGKRNVLNNHVGDDDDFENDDDNDDDDIGLTLKADKVALKSQAVVHQPDVKSRQSTPVQVHQRAMAKTFTNDQPCQDNINSLSFGSADEQSLDSVLPSSRQDRSIITRNSSILDSMREARSLLKNENGSAKSKANAIDILANAMSKANVEAKTGQRILESVTTRSTQGRAAPSHLRKDYQDMPKVNKVLQRLASNKDTKKVSLNAVKTPLKLLVEKAAEKKDTSSLENELVLKKDKSRKELPASNSTDVSGLLTAPVGIRAATGIFGNFLQQSGACSGQTSLLSTVFSANITAVGSESLKPKPALSRSWSSGDIKRLDKENLSDIATLPAELDSDDVGRVRRNSVGTDFAPSLSNVSKSSFAGLGTLKRSNSSGSFSDLAKQVEAKTTIDSPPKVTPFVSFDNYGVEDFSFDYGSSASTGTSTSITTTTTLASQSVATSTFVTGSKPTGFLRGLFLSSSEKSSKNEMKRPSSVYEGDSKAKTLGKGSSSSAESGMNRFGKALAQDDFGGFGFGFMSYFGGSKS